MAMDDHQPSASPLPILKTIKEKLMLLNNKTIVITGVSSGIGADTAKLMRQQGARVIGLDRNDPMLTLDGFVKADLGDPKGIEDAVKQLPQRIDGLCNVAGVPGTSPVDLVARVNYLGLREFTEKLIDRMSPGGCVVNFASILGYFYAQRLDQHKALANTPDFNAGLAWLKQHPVEQKTCYEYFKEALIVWSMQRSHTLFMQKDIRMNIVSPGPVFTPILGEFVAQLGQERVEADAARMKRPAFSDEIAPVAAFLCSDAARWINGANVPVDGGFAATYL
jgi:NAD(P)-dependent dehydrogenase (short-subunit alcohol dehydrogenase family)